MRLKIQKNNLNDYVASSFIVIYIATTIIFELQLPGKEYINQILIIFFGFLIFLYTVNYTFFKLELKRFSKISLLLWLLFFFILINSFFIRGIFLTGAVFNLFVGYVIGKYLSTKNNLSNIILLPFWGLTIYIFYKLSINLDPNEVFIRSRNYISFFLIITVLPYYINRINFHKSFSIYPALITLILAVYTFSRSGIISSFILFFGVLYFSKISKTLKRILFSVFFVLFFIFLTFLLQNFADATDIIRLIYLSEYVDLGGRSTFFINYYNNLNFLSFIFGMNTDTYEILNIGGSYFPGHVHSSILNFISVVGIMSFVFFKFLYDKSKFFLKHNPALFLLLISLIFRITTETGMLFGYFDYVIWMFLFCNFHPNYDTKN